MITWKQTLDRYDVEVYGDGRWFMYDGRAPEVVASGRSRWRLLRLVQITLAYRRCLIADRRLAATWTNGEAGS